MNKKQLLLISALTFNTLISNEDLKQYDLSDYYVLDLTYEQAMYDVSIIIEALNYSEYNFNLDDDIVSDSYFQSYLVDSGLLDTEIVYSDLNYKWEYVSVEFFEHDFLLLSNVSDNLCSKTNFLTENDITSVEEFNNVLENYLGQYNEICSIGYTSSDFPVNLLMVFLD